MSDTIQRQGSLYSSEDRRMAAIQYVLLGSMRRTAEATAIPVRTLYDWQKTDWWETLVAQVRKEMEGELDATLSKIIQLALAATMDRLENGDYIVTPKGETRRKPISARDAMTILGVAMTQQMALRQGAAASQRKPLSDIAKRLRRIGSEQLASDSA